MKFNTTGMPSVSVSTHTSASSHCDKRFRQAECLHDLFDYTERNSARELLLNGTTKLGSMLLARGHGRLFSSSNVGKYLSKPVKIKFQD